MYVFVIEGGFLIYGNTTTERCVFTMPKASASNKYNYMGKLLFYRLAAADRPEYCFTKDFFYLILFLKFIFEPNFFQIHLKKSWG